MIIKVMGAIGIVSTKQKAYKFKRKGYYYGDKWVKSKIKIKYKEVPIKQPYLFGDIQLLVNEKLYVNSVYMDEHKRTYMCVNVISLFEPESKLRVLSPNLGKAFSVPHELVEVYKTAAE